MKKRSLAVILALVLGLSMLLPALSETRETVIMLEGEEETVTETRFDSPQGFSFWYSDGLIVYNGERDNITGTIVTLPADDNFMVLSMIPEEDAVEYTEDLGRDIVEESAVKRVQLDVYNEMEGDRIYFLTLVAENGLYFRAVGEYSLEAAEGGGVRFSRLLDSVSFSTGCIFRAEWGTEETGEDDEDDEDDEGDDYGMGRAQVVLTAQEAVKDAYLLRLNWEGVSVTWEKYIPFGDVRARQQLSMVLEFVGDMPDYGVAYTDGAGKTHAYALDVSGEDGSLYFWDLEEE